MTSSFDVKEHVIEAQHIREYPRATAHSQEEVLKLAIKQYIPKDNPNPQPGDITIIGAHANGFVKELYEPLWDDLHGELQKRGLRIRSIWIADVAWQGQSGIINEDNLGPDPSWTEHARDLLHMVNHFRKDMVRPLVGVAHSFGGNSIVNLALLHPRLLTTLICLDPVMSNYFKSNYAYALRTSSLSASRRDIWPSREEAAKGFARSKFFQSWDPRCLAQWNRYALRETPTKVYPDEAAPKVTLTTTKHQEVFTFYRPVAQVFKADGTREVDPSKVPDLDESFFANTHFNFYRPEGPMATERLPTLRPSVLYIFGESSDVCPESIRQEKMQLTGTGLGGSGGVKKGRVEQQLVKGLGHLFPMECPRETASWTADWLKKEMAIWQREEKELEPWFKSNDRSKFTMDDNWKRWLEESKNFVPKHKI